MTAPHAVTAELVDAASFAPFGRVVPLADGGAAGLVSTLGTGWADVHTPDALIAENPSLGMTSAGSAPFRSTVMERHANVEEALLPMASALVLAVAAATDGDAPCAGDVRAFVIPVGSAVVLDRGVWHDACRGADGETAYYWLASCADAGSSPWTVIADGPVDVRVAA